MRVLHVVRQYDPCIGGIENVIHGLNRELMRRGHQTGVLTLDRSFTVPPRHFCPEETIKGVPVRRVRGFGSQRYCFAPGILRFLKGWDLIHLHSFDFFLDFLSLTKPWHRKPLVASTHGLFFHTPFAACLKKIYFRTVTQASLRGVDAIIADSEEDRAAFRGMASEKRATLVSNGVDLDPFRGALETVRAGKKEPGLFLATGRLAPNKRFDRVVRVFASVAQDWPEARLVITGPDWGEEAAIRRVVSELALESRVTLTGGIPRERLDALFLSADFWLSGADYEGFGLGLVEAMAAGAVPIVQPLPTFAEILGGTGEPGLLVDFDDPEAAARAVLCLREAPASAPLRERLIRRADAFSDAASASSTLRIYEQVLGANQERDGDRAFKPRHHVACSKPPNPSTPPILSISEHFG